MEPISLRLKGFKGIKRGQGKNEIFFDFSSLPEGLITLVGPNGRGKTTVLDNMHPYRVMPSRNKTYYELCEGDAEKEFIFANRGCEYKSLILIDVKRKKQEAYLYRKENGVWLPLNDGTTSSYDEVVNNLFSSEQIFFISVFRCQNAKPLSALTKGELKDIFEDLLLLGKIRELGCKARDVRKGLESHLDSLVYMRNSLVKTALDIDLKKNELKAVEDKLEILADISQNLSTAIVSTEQEYKNLLVIHTEQKAVAESITSLNKGLELKEGKLNRVNKIIANEEIIRGKASEEVEVRNNMDSLKKSIAQLETELGMVQKEIDALKPYELEVVHIQTNIEKMMMIHKTDINTLSSDISNLICESEKLQGIPCLNSQFPSQCKFVSDALKSRDLIDLKTADLNAKKSSPLLDVDVLQCRLVELQKMLSQLGNYGNRKADVSREIANLKKSLAGKETLLNDILIYTKLLPELELSKQSAAELNNEISSIISQLNEYKQKLDNTVGSRLNTASSALKTHKADLDRTNKEIVELYTKSGAIEESVRQMENAGKELESVNAQITCLEHEISLWRVIGKGLGQDGIIALEIDEAGPTVSALANDLLNTCFGSKFAVSIETTRQKNDGSTQEVFDIRVIDTEQNDSKSLTDLSGGERVWVEEAVTKAICLYNLRNITDGITTLFSDEKDGALDYKKKQEYLLMKKRVLQLGGFKREFFITHSLELQEMADGQIGF